MIKMVALTNVELIVTKITLNRQKTPILFYFLVQLIHGEYYEFFSERKLQIDIQNNTVTGLFPNFEGLFNIELMRKEQIKNVATPFKGCDIVDLASLIEFINYLNIIGHAAQLELEEWFFIHEGFFCFVHKISEN